MPPAQEEYTPHRRAIPPRSFEGPPDRQRHAVELRDALLHAEAESSSHRDEVQISVHGAEPGLYIQFQSPAGVDLKLESLENRPRGIELLAVRETTEPEEPVTQLATVFIPEGNLGHFLERFEQYAEEETQTGQPRHRELVERIAGLRRASLRALWTDHPDLYPPDDRVIWWEAWLRRDDGRELERFLDFASQVDLNVGPRRLAFDDRTVVLVRGTADQLARSLDVLNDLAEVRKAKESATFFTDAPPNEQEAWLEDLENRTTPPAPDAPAVCILDSGVTRGHPLLEKLIAPADATAVDPAWGPHDDGGGAEGMGHGTEMAGLAAYGDLTEALSSGMPLTFRHRLESVKILPRRGANPPELYGALTAEAVSRPEIQAPRRLRLFSLAVTATDARDRGEPTSWSAAIDALAVGRTFDSQTRGLVYFDEAEKGAQRLFVVSAGNVDAGKLDLAHLDRSDLEPVHDPAHAWNVLTVGAVTEKAVVTDQEWEGWSALARPGELSPWSTTSVTFQTAWPLKPDVVFEGGNVAHSGDDIDFPVPDLCLLSTHFRPAESPFTLSWATSAATAQVARIAAIIRAEYPSFWPETVRALIVHSGRWTRQMKSVLLAAAGKTGRRKLVRRYGYGVPNAEYTLRSADDALTLIAQATIRPFSDGKMREMHLHELPWPTNVLAELGEVAVRLRVTLSYFIEPNPGRRGWKRRHRYASHGLRFDVKSPTESVDEFRKRMNKKALGESEAKPTTGGDPGGWYLGEQTRNKGSVHSDVWTGVAGDLADRGFVGVYPVSGWWKEQTRRDRSAMGARYSLVVSIETEAEDVDIWTPVAQEIGVPVEVVAES